ncbi:hypothetical protein [Microcoleus sp. K5-D4]|uniref:hypothetical protein n=1 Tax=Microcoleus sp. K5-D4 TaxID=2818801 RepID=UPI002FD39E1D
MLRVGQKRTANPQTDDRDWWKIRSQADLADIVAEFILMWSGKFVRSIYLPAQRKNDKPLTTKTYA